MVNQMNQWRVNLSDLSSLAQRRLYVFSFFIPFENNLGYTMKQTVQDMTLTLDVFFPTSARRPMTI